MAIGQIIAGTYDNLVGNNQSLYEQRMEICRGCKLLKIDNILGEVCNSRLYLNPDTDEVSKTKMDGFYRGCGCILGSKTRRPGARCPAKKW